VNLSTLKCAFSFLFQLIRVPGWTLAIERGCDAVVKILLDNGAEVNIKNNKNEIALMFAADDYYCDKLEAVSALLDKGSEVNAKNNDGETALMIAAQRGCINIVKLLLERGADVKQKDNFGKTALDFAEKVN
jgi:ankyrin repeat protein